ncbi:MAG: hypothetical protein LBK68_04440 [Candidatus Margulisbacteria bacterium]|nr:hypothetical protein [Candidatus Margulisiibacteriota bacterium]
MESPTLEDAEENTARAQQKQNNNDDTQTNQILRDQLNFINGTQITGLKINKSAPPAREITFKQRAFLTGLERKMNRVQNAWFDFTRHNHEVALRKFINNNIDLIDAIAANKDAMLEVLQILGRNPEVDVNYINDFLARMSPEDRNSPEFVSAILSVDRILIEFIRYQEDGEKINTWDGCFYLTGETLGKLIRQNPENPVLWLKFSFNGFKNCPPEITRAAIASGHISVSALVNEAMASPHLTQNFDPEHKMLLLEIIKNSEQPLKLSGKDYLVLRSFFPEEPVESLANVSIRYGENKDYLDTLFQRCQNTGINCAERFDPQTLEKLLLFREQPLDHDKPVALVITPLRIGDHNGAFQDSQYIADLLAHDYQVCYYEIGAETEIPAAFANTYSCNNPAVDAGATRKIDVVVFGGHGTKNSIQLGNIPSAPKTARIFEGFIEKYNRASGQQNPPASAGVLQSARQILLDNGLTLDSGDSNLQLKYVDEPFLQLNYAELDKYSPEARTKLFADLELLSPFFVRVRADFAAWLAYDRSLVDTSDKELADCDQYLSETGIIVANSCFNGYKLDINGDGVIDEQDNTPENRNIIDAFYEWFSGAERRFYGAPDVQYGAPQINFAEDNSINDVSYTYADLALSQKFQKGAYYRNGSVIRGEMPVSPPPFIASE